ncbi:MAG: Crp/Fnr family transcriptional regulator [Lachnospiraceae bacterium]|nr:Crp/Fnr family transcriptional regulator [Lachnospiraceae bacterium]
MKMQEMVEEIRECRLFQNMSDEEILLFIKQNPCKIICYRNGDCVISKDEDPTGIGIILEGSVGIYTDSFYGDHTLIGIGDSDYLFGFIATFYNQSNSITTLYCRKHCRIAYFQVAPADNAVSFIARTSPKLLSNIFHMLTKHIRDDFDRMHIISTNSVRTKIVRYILYRHSCTQALSFDLLYNRTELASFLGIYRTSLSHELLNMKKQGLIQYTRNTLFITDLNALIAIECESYE